MRGTTSAAQFVAALALGTLVTAGSGARDAVAGDVPKLLEVDVDLRIVGPDEPENGTPNISPLEGVEARLFVRDAPPPAPADLPAEFDQGKSIAAAKTSSDGSCVLGVPSGVEFDVVLRWEDPDTGQAVYAYLGVNVGESANEQGIVERSLHLMKLIRSNGTVQYSSGQKHTVTG